MQLDIRYIVIIFFIFSLHTFLFSQKDYKWPAVQSVTRDIPAQFANADAVILRQYEERESKTDPATGLFSRNIIKRRVKILTTKGIDTYARIVIPQKDNMVIEVLDARTIKQDGTVVDLNASDIRELEFSDFNLSDTYRYRLFAVPGLEVGDEFEMICIQSGTTIELRDDVYLHTYLPVLHTEFVLNVDKQFLVYSNYYNAMPKPQVTENLSEIRIAWQLKNLDGLYDERYTIPALSLPFLMYEISLEALLPTEVRPKPDTWLELMKIVHSYLNRAMRINKARMRTHVQAALGNKTYNSTLDHIKHLHHFINDHFTIRPVSDKEKENTLDYFFEKRIADQEILILFYKFIFEEYKQKYYIAAGRSRYAGPFRTDFPSLLQISDIAFVAEAGAVIHTFFPPTPYSTFAMDEVPPYLQGTPLFLISPDNTKDFKSLDLPKTHYKNNTYKHQAKVGIFARTDSCSFTCKDVMAGAVSSHKRHRYMHVNQENLTEMLAKNLSERLPGCTLTSASMPKTSVKPPFSCDIEYTFVAANPVVRLDENLYKIPLNHCVRHALFPVVSSHRLLDYHPPFSGREIHAVLFEFDEAIQIIEHSSHQYKMSNDIGDYMLSITQINERSIIVRSELVLKVDVIPASQMQKYIDLLETAQYVEKIEVVVKM